MSEIASPEKKRRRLGTESGANVLRQVDAIEFEFSVVIGDVIHSVALG